MEEKLNTKTTAATINSPGMNQTNETIKKYQTLVRDCMSTKSRETTQQKWDNIVEFTTNAATYVAGYKEKKKKSASNIIKHSQQSKMHYSKVSTQQLALCGKRKSKKKGTEH